MRHRHAHISTSARPVDVPRSAIRSASRTSSSMSSGPLVASCRAVSASMMTEVSPSSFGTAEGVVAHRKRLGPTAAVHRRLCLPSQQPDPGLLIEPRGRQRLRTPLVHIPIP